MDDVECPYCGKGQDICHDDGFGYEEDRAHEQECGNCENTFVFHTSISFDYDAAKAPCLNGHPHKMEPVMSYPRAWPDWKRCADCDHEVRGEYDPDYKNTPPPAAPEGRE